jgi:flagellar L-ring protein precursor FlgH
VRAALPIVVAGLAGLVGCAGTAHIKPFTPRSRQYIDGQYAVTELKARPSPGSLFSEAAPGFLQDTRAVRTGDIVLINIDEQANATGDAATQLAKSTSKSTGVTALLGLVPALKKLSPSLDPTNLLALMSQSNFSGTGQTSRNGQLSGYVAVRVRKQMPNGDLYVEGTKVVMINNEEYHLYVSGVIRPADVAQDNSVASSKVADAEVEFTGRGDMADSIDRGWFTKLIDWLNPF